MKKVLKLSEERVSAKIEADRLTLTIRCHDPEVVANELLKELLGRCRELKDTESIKESMKPYWCSRLAIELDQLVPFVPKLFKPLI